MAILTLPLAQRTVRDAQLPAQLHCRAPPCFQYLHGVAFELFIVTASSPSLTSLLILIHVQVPSLAPVRQIEATPGFRDRKESEDDDDEHEDEDPCVSESS